MESTDFNLDRFTHYKDSKEEVEQLIRDHEKLKNELTKEQLESVNRLIDAAEYVMSHSWD